MAESLAEKTARYSYLATDYKLQAANAERNGKKKEAENLMKKSRYYHRKFEKCIRGPIAQNI